MLLSYLFYMALIFALVYWLQLPLKSQPNHLIISRSPGDQLESWLKSFSWGTEEASTQLPRYKFYTEVLETILTLSRKMGGAYQESLLFLRQGLQRDRQFEKKLRELLLSIWLQLGLMLVLTWGFIVAALLLADVRPPTLLLLGILGWQTIGFLLLPLVLAWLRERLFGGIGRLWKMLYVLQCLGKVPVPRSEIMVLAGVPELKQIQEIALLPLAEKLRRICQRALQVGGSYETEVTELMEELRFQESWHYDLFEKRLTVIKLALLAIFFLPSYLAFIFSMLGQFLGNL